MILNHVYERMACCDGGWCPERFSAGRCRTPDMGIVGATTDSFILFENGVTHNRLVLPGLSNAADNASTLAR
jgi:hypothetical protein